MYYAKQNLLVRERQISYDFTHISNLKNLLEDHRGRERKIRYKQRETNHKRLLNKENKLRVAGEVVGGEMG